MINQTMARRFFPGQSAVGKRWNYGPIDKDAFTIVGVVEDAHYLDIRTAPPNMVYHLAEATPDDVLSDIEIRTAGTPAALAQTVRDTIAQAEPRLPIVEVLPLTARIDRGTTEDRMVAHLTSIFGGLALLGGAADADARSARPRPGRSGDRAADGACGRTERRCAAFPGQSGRSSGVRRWSRLASGSRRRGSIFARPSGIADRANGGAGSVSLTAFRGSADRWAT